MDFNDISLRLQRVYNTIGKQYEDDINRHAKRIIEQLQDNHKVAIVTFGNYDETELYNRVFAIVTALASLKDHLKKSLKSMGKDPKTVETMIENSEELKLIMDLWNQDKHGYPLTKYIRSYKNPQVVNIRQGLTMTGGTSGSVSFSMTNKKIGDISATKNTVIKINGDVVDDQGNLIIRLDEMIDRSLKAIEKFIQDNKLI